MISKIFSQKGDRSHTPTPPGDAHAAEADG
jgi:hypothetical protein